MFFLAFNLLKPSTWLSGTAEGLMGSILSGLRTMLFNLVAIIYQLIVNVYNLFEKLCSARLLNNDILKTMSQRVGIILGLIMFFYIVFSFIQMLIDPEKMTNKDSGATSIIKKTILVIVMLGISNSFFNLTYKIQQKIIEEDIISRLILPYTVKEETKNSFGNLLSMSLIEAFYYVDDNSKLNATNSENANAINACTGLVNSFYKQIYTSNNYDYGYMCLNEYANVNKDSGITDEPYEDQVYIVNFNGILAILVGAYVLYMLVHYTIKVGVRMIQLAFLEIISPMAIISYISPKKDNMFGKWTKIYFATYIDVFIRIAIINLIVFLICTIFSASSNYGLDLFETIKDTYPGGEIPTQDITFFTVVIILALLTFAKKAPDLIKELLPAGASKLGFGTTLKDIVGFEKGAKIGAGILGGALGGAAIGLIGGAGIKGKIGGFTGGLLKGGLSGFKGQGLTKTAASAWKNQQATNRRISEWRAAGGTNSFSRWGAAFNQWRGADTVADVFEREKADIEAENALYNQFAGYFDKGKGRAKEKIETGDFELDTFAKDQTAYDAALAVFKQKQRIDLLKASAANADNTIKDANGLTELDKLNEQIANEMVSYNKNLDNAVYSYLDKNNNMETAKDKVIAQQYAGAYQMKNSHPSLFGEMDITTAEKFKKSGDISKGKISDNENKLIKNKAAGEKARADAKYSGRK